MTASKIKAKSTPTSTGLQPVSDLQLKQLVVEWIPHTEVKPNHYNPNKTTAQQRNLIRQSILEDGWTAPIVTLDDGVIVDGEQRWTAAGMPLAIKDIEAIITKMEERSSKGFQVSESILWRLRESRARLSDALERGETTTLATITGGLVPVTRVNFGDEAHRRISTIRHNTARGQHVLDLTADIIQDLQTMGMDMEDFEVRLGMDDEEIRRLLETVDLPEQLVSELEAPISQAWSPVHVQALAEDELAMRGLQRSQAAQDEAKQYELQKRDRQREIEQRTAAKVAKVEATGKALTQDEKASIVSIVSRDVPEPAKPAPPPQLKKFTFFVTESEFERCVKVLGDAPVQGFLALCRAAYEAEYGAWDAGTQTTGG